MKATALGELRVSPEGLGCMGMSEYYGSGDWDASIATIHRALELGVTLIDTADIYGSGHNEVLVGRALHDRRSWCTAIVKAGEACPRRSATTFTGCPCFNEKVAWVWRRS